MKPNRPCDASDAAPDNSKGRRPRAGRDSEEWVVYLLKCGDGSLYCGITNHFERRLAAHANGTGARYTRGRGPLTPVVVVPFPDKSRALKAEIAVKKQPASRKIAYLQGLAQACFEESD